MAGEPGFEPGLTESESAGLPLTYSPTPRSLRPSRGLIKGVRAGFINFASREGFPVRGGFRLSGRRD